jgi:hypothetical protein
MTSRTGPGPTSLLARLTRFWADDKGLSIFSALLCVVIFVIPVLLPPGSGRRPVGVVAYALLLVSGVLALGERRLTRLSLLPVALLALALELGSWFAPVPEAWVEGTSLLSLVAFLVVVLGQTLRTGPVTLHRIQGGVAAYLLLGVIWAHAYSLVALLRPGSFSGAANLTDGPRGWLYFSFVTLTTMGYGDVLPVHPTARSLATAEAVTGSLYLAILIGRLVGLAVAPPAQGKGE